MPSASFLLFDQMFALVDGQGERWLALSRRREVNDGSAARVV